MKQETIELLAIFRNDELVDRPDLIKKSFDATHLKNIHAYLFQDSRNECSLGNFTPLCSTCTKLPTRK